MTEKELSVMHACFDDRGRNHCHLTDCGDSVYIRGPAYCDLKSAVITKEKAKYNIEWNWAGKNFKASNLNMKQIKKILKFYSGF